MMISGQSLSENTALVSRNGLYTFIAQDDRNLVLYDIRNEQQIWSSGTAYSFLQKIENIFSKSNHPYTFTLEVRLFINTENWRELNVAKS